MQGQLVNVMTADRVRLDGFYVAAEKSVDGSIDAAVITHGLSGNFYGSRLLKHIAEHLSQKGISSVLINTRGHDYLNATVRSGRSQTLGAAFERIDECPCDLNAWVDFLVDRGHQNIILAGHSLGAIKSLYAQAHTPHSNVVGVCGLSATRLSYDGLLASSGGEQFSKWLRIAQEWVAEQRSDDLLFVDFPFATWMSAGAYLEKYGAGDRFNWLNFADQILVPTWLGFGELELNENPAFAGLDEELEQIANRSSHFTIDTIAGADHFYSARYDAATTAVSRWIDRLSVG